jgi:hypothetical protein
MSKQTKPDLSHLHPAAREIAESVWEREQAGLLIPQPDWLPREIPEHVNRLRQLERVVQNHPDPEQRSLGLAWLSQTFYNRPERMELMVPGPEDET